MFNPIFITMMDLFLFQGSKRLIVSALPEEVPLPLAEGLADQSELVRVSSGEASLEELGAIAARVAGGPLYLMPDFTPPRHLSPGLRQQYPRMGLPEISLEVVLSALEPGARVGIWVPAALVVARSTGAYRQRILAAHRLDGLVFHGSEHGLPLDPRLETVSLFFRSNHGDGNRRHVTRFFRTRGAELDCAAVEAELGQLLRMNGGRLQHGFVLRDRLTEGSAITFEKFDPVEVARRSEVGELGQMVGLSDLVTYVRPALNVTSDRALLVEPDKRQGVCAAGVVTPRTVARGLLSDPELIVAAEDIPGGAQLQPGDICVAGVISPSVERMSVARVEASHLPLVADTRVHVLRPNPKLSPEQHDVLVAYLRSRACLRTLRAEGIGLHVDRAKLLDLRVPSVDEDLELALQSLNEAVAQLDAWRQDAEDARDHLFDFEGVADARLHVLSVGRNVRQRVAAAALADDVAHRLRTRLPHPLAFRWRTVEAATPDLEGYVQLLECTETAVTYVAVMGIVLAQHQGVRLSKLRELSQRLSRSGSRGISLGDWKAIATEVAQSRAFAALPAEAPFYELTKLFSVEGAREALAFLTAARNDQAHGRGPKGEAVTEAYFTARQQLQALLEALDFTSEYPLRYVEHSRWDSIRGLSSLQYRELLGDHPLTMLEDEEHEGAPIEAQSLYLVDRQRSWHLLRPLLLRHACPECGKPSTFVLDSVDARAGSYRLKCMEDSHVHQSDDKALLGGLRHVGLLGDG